MADDWEKRYFNDSVPYDSQNIFATYLNHYNQWGWQTDLSKLNVGESIYIPYIHMDGNTRRTVAADIPPNYKVRLDFDWNTWNIGKYDCGKIGNRLPAGGIVSTEITKCDTWDDYKAKCCLGPKYPETDEDKNPYGEQSCRIFWGDKPESQGRCDYIIQNWCAKPENKDKIQCSCINPKVPEYIKTSLEKAGQLGKLWGFDNNCTGSSSSYKPDYAKRDINFTLNQCTQIVNITDNKNLLMDNTEFNQYCPGAMTEYQKGLLDELNNLLNQNDINIFNDLTEEEVVVYNNCVKQINETADSSCIKSSVIPIINTAKQRKELITQNIAKLTKLPGMYNIQDSDFQSVGEYSIMAYNDCRNIYIPKGNYQCITDFENYFKQVQQKKIEEQKRLEEEELLRQQQQASSVYDDGSLGSYTPVKETPTPTTNEVPDYQPDPVGGQDVTPDQIINALEGKEEPVYQQPQPTNQYQQPTNQYQQPTNQYQQPQPSYQPQLPVESNNTTTYLIIGVLIFFLIVIFVLVMGVVAYGSIGGAYEKIIKRNN